MFLTITLYNSECNRYHSSKFDLKHFGHLVILVIFLIFDVLYNTYTYYLHIYLGPDHLRLTLLNWDNESVLALNKKLKFPIHFQFFIKCQNTLGIPIE